MARSTAQTNNALNALNDNALMREDDDDDQEEKTRNSSTIYNKNTSTSARKSTEKENGHGGERKGGERRRTMHRDLIMHDVANLVLLPMVSVICVAGLTGAIAPRFSTFVIFFYILGDLIWVLKRPKTIPGLYWVIVAHHFVVLLLVRLISICMSMSMTNSVIFIRNGGFLSLSLSLCVCVCLLATSELYI